MPTDGGFYEDDEPVGELQAQFDAGGKGVTRAPVLLWLPAVGLKWLNSNDRLHPMAKSRIVKQWRQLGYACAIREHLPRLGKAHIEARLFFRTNARRDPNNWAPTAKAALDGLVDANVFPDDNADLVIGPDMRLGGIVTAAANTGMLFLITPQETESDG